MIIDYVPTKLDIIERKPLTGKYGRLTPLYPTCKKGHHIYYYCKCDCGNYCITGKEGIVSGSSKSCGCLRSDLLKEQHQHNREQNMIGKQFGKVKVLAFDSFYQDSDNPRTKQSNYLCKCLVCGKEFVARGCHLVTGGTKSCGCVKSHSEQLIIDFLTKNNIEYQKEYSFADLKDKHVLRFDFAIKNNQSKLFLIEYQGSQHTETNNGFYSETTAAHDAMKKQYCLDHNIDLYIIDYKDQTIEKLKEILDREGISYEL